MSDRFIHPGSGIYPESVARRAVRKGLVGRELTEEEAEEFERWKVIEEAERNRTLDDLRTILYFGEIETDKSKEVIRKMLEFEAKNAGEPIILKISSSGGSALDGLAIVETMRTITSPVMTFCLGYAFSMALVILAAGAKGSRFCTRGSWVMMHQISAGRYQRFDELKTTFTFYERLNTQLAQILADSSGQKRSKIEQDMREDVWMAANQAKDFGLIDAII